jgi:excisionase family DNA binding protein
MKEACEFLQVSHATVYRWINDGRLRAYKAGRAIRFRKEDLLGALEEWTPDDNVPYRKGERKASTIGPVAGSEGGEA